MVSGLEWVCRSAFVGAALSVCLFVSSCGKSATTAPPQPGAAEQAADAVDRIALLVKDVHPDGFNQGAPSQCTVLYNVLNNTGNHLYKANVSLGGYEFEIGDLAANSHFTDDQSFTVDPINSSCVAVADKLVQAAQQPSPTDCSLEGVKEGDCQAKIAAFVALDKNADVKIQQIEHAGAQEFAAQQAAAEQQAKAEQWSQRGQFEVPTGAAFVTPNVNSAPVLAAVTAPDFDPTKLAPDTQVATSNVPLCVTTDPSSNEQSSGRLIVSQEFKDQFGLTAWYKLKMVCGDAPQIIWVASPTMNSLEQSGQLVKQSG